MKNGRKCRDIGYKKWWQITHLDRLTLNALKWIFFSRIHWNIWFERKIQIMHSELCFNPFSQTASLNSSFRKLNLRFWNAFMLPSFYELTWRKRYLERKFTSLGDKVPINCIGNLLTVERNGNLKGDFRNETYKESSRDDFKGYRMFQKPPEAKIFV